MKLYKKIKIAIFMAAGLIGFAVSSVIADQDVKITIKEVKAEDTVYTPYYEIQTEQDHKQGAAQKWIRLGVYFTTEGGWIDEIDVTQMAMLDCDSKSCLALAETVHYINIEPGDHVVYVYLHPSYVKRYQIDAFDLDSAAVIHIDGKQVAAMETSRRFEEGWSKGGMPSTAKSYLLNHAETPFWFINYDFKEIIKRTNLPVE
ncbi:hypothetical protein P4C99_18195 [Pontiellaceae bacterium B1224]|nr:hypothetical protein [Pontiellaceae bacterium B1224]